METLSQRDVRERAEARRELALQNERIELRELLADEKVRRLLWRYMGRAGMFEDHFNTNAAVMGRNTGFAAMGRVIYNDILEAFPEAWILMQQESLERQRAEEAMAQMEQAELDQANEEA